jgi:hypothetical protein
MCNPQLGVSIRPSNKSCLNPVKPPGDCTYEPVSAKLNISTAEHIYVGSEVFTAVVTGVAIFWGVDHI